MIGRPQLRAHLRSDDGVTLTELLVTMAAATIVLLAILGLSDSFGRVAGANTVLTQSEDGARLALNQMASNIGNALTTTQTVSGNKSPIGPLIPASVNDPRASSTTDLVFVTSSLVSGTGSIRYAQPRPARYCLDTAGRGIIWVGTQTTYVGPTSQYAPPGAACTGAAANGWSYSEAIVHVLDGSQLFPSPGALAPGTVGASLSLTVASGRTSSTGAPVPLTYRAVVNVRNAQNVPRVATADFVCTPTSPGPFTIALRPNATTGSDGQPLTVMFYSTAAKTTPVGTGSVVVAASGTASYWVTERTASGLTSSAATDVDNPIQVTCG